MGCGILPEVLDTLGELPGGPGRVGGPSGRCGTGRRTLPEVRYRSGDPLEVLAGLADLRVDQGRVGGPLGRSRTRRETLPEVRDWSGTLGVVRDWTGDPPRGPGHVRRP